MATTSKIVQTAGQTSEAVWYGSACLPRPVCPKNWDGYIDFGNGFIKFQISWLCYLSRNVRKPTKWILARSDTNQAVQPLEIVRGVKFCMKEVEVLFYPCSENKGADQLSGYCEADLRLCFRICKTLVFSWRGSFVTHIISRFNCISTNLNESLSLSKKKGFWRGTQIAPGCKKNDLKTWHYH